AYLWYPTVFLTGALSDYAHFFGKIWYHCISFEISGVLALLTIYLLARRYSRTAPLYLAFRFWAALTGALLLGAFDARFTFMNQMRVPVFANMDYITALISMLVFAAYPFVVCYKNRLAVIGLLGTVILGGVACLIQVPIWGICMTLFLLTILAAYCAVNNNLYAFNIVIGIIFVRLVLAYFHLFASLAVTGVGLILLGIAILIGIKVFIRYRTNLINYLQKLK
ncbi:MAG: hypothetical protein IJV07_02885, partial [Alphaproteobacteria bacterium]|nr:hypothetical protein [Alphaproteobacteria bacterium]